MRKNKSVINQAEFHNCKKIDRVKNVGQFLIVLIRTAGSTIRGLFKGKNKSFKFRFSETVIDEEGRVRRTKDIEIDYIREE